LQERKEHQLVLTNFHQSLQKESPDHFRYLLAFTLEEWQKIEVKLAEQNLFRGDLRNFQRFLTSKVENCPLDRLGRILIPPNLRDYASLSREVCLVGTVRSIEIWDRASYEAHMKQLEEFNFEGILDELSI
jgi:MraZ protein